MIARRDRGRRTRERTGFPETRSGSRSWASRGPLQAVVGYVEAFLGCLGAAWAVVEAAWGNLGFMELLGRLEILWVLFEVVLGVSELTSRGGRRAPPGCLGSLEAPSGGSEVYACLTPTTLSAPHVARRVDALTCKGREGVR